MSPLVSIIVVSYSGYTILASSMMGYSIISIIGWSKFNMQGKGMFRSQIKSVISLYGDSKIVNEILTL